MALKKKAPVEKEVAKKKAAPKVVVPQGFDKDLPENKQREYR